MPLYKATNNSDWIQVYETFAYASATTITVASGAASRWQKGDKLMFTQHGVIKFGYVIVVASTLLTFCSGSAYTIEDTATYPIVAISYSRVENPFGFPLSFDYSPVITAYAGTPTTTTSSIVFCIKGGVAFVSGLVSIINKGTASSVLRIQSPSIPLKATSGSGIEGGATGYSCAVSMVADTALIDAQLYNSTTLWVNGYNLRFSISYFI